MPTGTWDFWSAHSTVLCLWAEHSQSQKGFAVIKFTKSFLNQSFLLHSIHSQSSQMQICTLIYLK